MKTEERLTLPEELLLLRDKEGTFRHGGACLYQLAASLPAELRLVKGEKMGKATSDVIQAAQAAVLMSTVLATTAHR